MELKEMFKPQAKSIKQIFGDADSYYQIPDYQRPYSWETEQIEELWDDVFNAMETNQETYFLGAVILASKGEYYEVIDGQQRLTTLTILLCVARDLYLSEERSVKNSIRSLIDDKFRLRLITQSKNQSKFEKEILEKVNFPKNKLSQEELEKDAFINAITIFKDRFKKIGTKIGVQQFIDFLMNKVVLISIVCTDQAFAIRLFQVLNTRGLDLNNSDIIKSYLYGICEKGKESQLKSSWEKIETIAEILGEDIDSIITYYALFLIQKNPQTTLSTELMNHKEFKNKSATDLIYDILKFTESLKKLYNSESKVDFSFHYLPNHNYWVTILTTAIHSQYQQYNELVITLHRFLWLYWISGYTIQKIKQTLFNTIGWIKEEKDISFIKKEFSKEIKEDSVIQYVKQNIDSDVYSQRWHKPLLILVEYFRADDSKLTWIEWDKNLQTEHILPKSWDSIADWKNNWKKEDADYWLNKFGNLTLLSGKKNIIVSNDSFVSKKNKYKKSHGVTTAFEVTKEISELDQWTIHETKKRHEQIRKEIFNIFEI